ncbi:hypothetical protein Tco_0160675, partial [Tanacetum coccineum]
MIGYGLHLNKGVQSIGSDEGSLTLNELTTKLILLVKKLEHKVKASKSRIRAIVIISDNEEDLEDSSRQGRIIDEIDQNPSISFLVLVSTASAIPEVSTAGVSTAKAELSTVISEVSTAAKNLVYIRRSAEKRKDKGKAIMKEDESVQKKTKKQLEQER